MNLFEPESAPLSIYGYGEILVISDFCLDLDMSPRYHKFSVEKLDYDS